MSLRTYRRESMSAALAEVKKELGEHAVILNTRSFREGGVMGWGGRACVEITATDDPSVVRRVNRRIGRDGGKAAPAGGPRPDGIEHSTNGGTQARAAVPQAKQVAAVPLLQAVSPVRPGTAAPKQVVGPASRLSPEPLLEAVAHSKPFEADAALLREIGAIRQMVRDVLTETRRDRLPDMPKELLDAYTRLVGQQVAEELARRLVEDARRIARNDNAGATPDKATVRRLLTRLIAESIPERKPFAASSDGRARVAALIGPTGVGKTTTVAKLAAAFKLRDGRRVGLITVDTYRIAAVEQLRVYANILDVPLEVVQSPAEMAQAVARLRDCDLILIDTAGRSPRDDARLGELKAFLAAAAPDEVHLVLASNASEPAVTEAIDRFSALKPDRLIFTKLDEAVGFGLLLNVLSSVNLRMSFLTTGQSVPADIEAASAQRVARLVLGVESVRAGRRVAAGHGDAA
ncbi:MAG: flagellar biosynthesis protein FlhF [Phycisphaerae bacterium]